MTAALRLAVAAVWIFFGLVLKVLGAEPRHRMIVAAVLGQSWAGPVTMAVGLGETALGLWVLSGRYPRLCAAVQTAAIMAMNTLELIHARDLLLAPIAMVLANLLFLATAWWVALHTPTHRKISPKLP